MGSLIHRGETGVWVSNGHRNDFLDWFAAHRCQPNDERRQYCKSEGHRWTGFCLDLDDLLRSAEVLELTADELARAKQELGFDGPQLLAVISKVVLPRDGLDFFTCATTARVARARPLASLN